jgi:hypothetical protein
MDSGGKGLAQVADKSVFLAYGDARLTLDGSGIGMKWKGMGKLGRNMKIDEKSGKITMG